MENEATPRAPRLSIDMLEPEELQSVRCHAARYTPRPFAATGLATPRAGLDFIESFDGGLARRRRSREERQMVRAHASTQRVPKTESARPAVRCSKALGDDFYGRMLDDSPTFVCASTRFAGETVALLDELGGSSVLPS